MKQFGLALLAGLVASSAMAQDADTARPIMTAEEACKLAYAWTGFDKNRPADLIPQCRAELVDSGYLKHRDLSQYVIDSSLWCVVFDSMRLQGLDLSDSLLRRQELKRCELLFGSTTGQLFLVSVFTIGADTSDIPAASNRRIDGCHGEPCNNAQPINLQRALAASKVINAFRQRLIECIVTDCRYLKSDDRPNEWKIYARGHKIPIVGDLKGRGWAPGAFVITVNAGTGEETGFGEQID